MDQRGIEEEIRGGLTNERRRLDRAKESLAVYRGDFAAYQQESWEYDSDGKSQRDLPLMSQIVDTLCRYLYRQDPVRIFPGHDLATEFLAQTYKHNKMTAMWQTADRHTHAADLFCFQIGGTADPKQPIKIMGWPSDSVAVWCDPDDPLVPTHVCTIDLYDEQRRYRLWSAETVSTFITKKWGPVFATAGATAPVLVDRQPNPYGLLPFAFAHYCVPTLCFYTSGPGDLISDMNLHVNRRLRLLADAIRYISKPIGVLEGVSPEYVLPHHLKPGEFVKLPPVQLDARGESVKPTLKYVTPPLEFVSREWEDLEHYFDLTLQSVGVPPAALRLVQTSARSGASIVAEQAPLMLYAKARANIFKYFEEDLARVVLQVASAHLSNAGIATGHLDEALQSDEGLQIRYAEPKPDISSQDRRDQESYLLDLGLVSRVQLAQEYLGVSRDDAVEHLKQVQEDETECPAPPPVVETPEVLPAPAASTTPKKDESNV